MSEIIKKILSLIDIRIFGGEEMADETNITEWFKEYHNDILNFLIYYTGMVDVEDLVQEVFIRAVRHVHKFKGKSNPRTWLISIARNVAIDEMRSRRKEDTKRNRIMHDIGFVPQCLSPEELFELNEIKAELYTTMKTLKLSYYDVLILRGIKELTVEETAETLNWSPHKVNLTYHRALKALEKKMRRSSL
jgi:RNA polymerase sigma-70 factor, ECF subfamily